jgi:hypothetical protein
MISGINCQIFRKWNDSTSLLFHMLDNGQKLPSWKRMFSKSTLGTSSEVQGSCQLELGTPSPPPPPICRPVFTANLFPNLHHLVKHIVARTGRTRTHDGLVDTNTFKP